MYNANAQNSLLRIRTELSECSYDQNNKDYLATLIMAAMNFPKKTSQVRHFIRNVGQNRLIMIWYPMSIPFMGKNYNIPLQIYIMKNMPYEPPQIFLEITQGTGANPNNRDVDPNTRKITTNSLRNWNQYSTIDNIMNEIFASFCKTFPIYKKTGNGSNPQSQSSESGGRENIYNNYNQGNERNYGYQPPENNNNWQQPNSVGEGFYKNNNDYNNINYNNQKPNSYGEGIYENNNYKNNNQQVGEIYNNNINNNSNNQYSGNIYNQSKKEPNEELKDILISQVGSKIYKTLISEKQGLYNQNQKMNNYKQIFSKEIEKLQNFIKYQNLIKTRCDEDMNHMFIALNRIQEQINYSKSMILNQDNCINLVEAEDPNALKLIAGEASLEEMILLVKRAFERKKISLEQAIMFTRNSSRDLFAIKFLKEKAINKYKN